MSVIGKKYFNHLWWGCSWYHTQGDGPGHQLWCHFNDIWSHQWVLPCTRIIDAQHIRHPNTCLLISENLLLGQGTTIRFRSVFAAATILFPFIFFTINSFPPLPPLPFLLCLVKSTLYLLRSQCSQIVPCLDAALHCCHATMHWAWLKGCQSTDYLFHYGSCSVI